MVVFMHKKRIKEKIPSKGTKKIYVSPQLCAHGNISEITRDKPLPDDDTLGGCTEP